MFHKKLADGLFGENTYIIGKAGHCFVIDPGAGLEQILAAVRQSGMKLSGIILTHMHYDHVCTLDLLKTATGAPVMIHRLDATGLGDPAMNCSLLFGQNTKYSPPDILLSDGDWIKAGDMELKVIHTPGHTPGGICLMHDDRLFTGDTLFNMSIGRTDLGGGEETLLLRSIRDRLMIMADHTVLYPGHGKSSTIGEEKKKNPFLYSLETDRRETI
ncbi:MAG TPA: MBL fold metallo-hydrolase [Clostridiales bacterium]|nr:MBL fold metallo-hydrolase [Clostridiales bacterium]